MDVWNPTLDMPDGNSAAELEYDGGYGKSSLPDWRVDEEIAERHARQVIADPAGLKQLDYDYEWTSHAYLHLARAFREIDGAFLEASLLMRGDRRVYPALEAVLQAVGHLQKDVLAVAMDDK